MSLQIKPQLEIHSPLIPNVSFNKQMRFLSETIIFKAEFTLKKSNGFLFFSIMKEVLNFEKSLDFRNFGNKNNMKKRYLQENETFIIEFKDLEANSQYFLYYMIGGDYAPSMENENIYSEVFMEVFSSEINDEEIIRKFGIGVGLCVGLPMIISLAWVLCNETMASCIYQAENLKFNEMNNYMEQLQGSNYVFLMIFNDF